VLVSLELARREDDIVTTSQGESKLTGSRAISGFVKPEFEAVRAAFIDNFERLRSGSISISGFPTKFPMPGWPPLAKQIRPVGDLHRPFPLFLAGMKGISLK
jgi:hypothetical protein